MKSAITIINGFQDIFYYISKLYTIDGFAGFYFAMHLRFFQVISRSTFMATIFSG